jgi:NhaP-type Na+/H+ or K+/H+ antiporter
MVSELTSISGAINSLTNMNGLPATIVEVVVTLIVRVLILIVCMILIRGRAVYCVWRLPDQSGHRQRPRSYDLLVVYVSSKGSTGQMLIFCSDHLHCRDWHSSSYREGCC